MVKKLKEESKKIDSTTSQDPYCEEAQKNARKSHWYSDIASSVTKCPFCDLKEKYLISQEEEAVLTVNLFPYIEGHLMVIPKRHIEKISEFSASEWESCKDLIALGVEVLKEALQVQDINILYREGSSKSGSSLKHLHIHLLPIKEGFMEYRDFGFTYKFQDINVIPLEVAKKLRKVCQKIQRSKKKEQK